MNEIYFASANQNKIREINALLPDSLKVLGIDKIVHGDLEETGTTLEENALMKAKAIHRLSGKPAFADDTGLEVYALNNAPGVYSARYAGPQRSDADNIIKLLDELAETSDRKARFRTVIAFVDGHQEKLFEGIVNGEIAFEPQGTNGFGYDPVFIPEGNTRTFAEMSLNEKNLVSHRARAFQAFAAHIADYSERG
jgi:XTP/dITP diphosphohydrolase